MAEKRTTYKIQDLGGIGEVQIADEVVAIIAGLAATEVDGVASMAGNITNELVSKLGMKNLSKGVKVTVLEGVVTLVQAVLIRNTHQFKRLSGSSKNCSALGKDSGEIFGCKHTVFPIDKPFVSIVKSINL